MENKRGTSQVRLAQGCCQTGTDQILLNWPTNLPFEVFSTVTLFSSSFRRDCFTQSRATIDSAVNTQRSRFYENHNRLRRLQFLFLLPTWFYYRKLYSIIQPLHHTLSVFASQKCRGKRFCLEIPRHYWVSGNAKSSFGVLMRACRSKRDCQIKSQDVEQD